MHRGSIGVHGGRPGRPSALRLKRGTPKIRFTEAQLLEGFIGGEIGKPTPKRTTRRLRSGYGGDAELDALMSRARR